MAAVVASARMATDALSLSVRTVNLTWERDAMPLGRQQGIQGKQRQTIALRLRPSSIERQGRIF